jgi:ribose 5-phosphate isomerase A
MAPDAEVLKRKAALAAFGEIRSGMVVGLGTGSTVAHLLQLVGEALRTGELRDVVGVPTSVQTARLAERLGIPLAGLGDHPEPDLAIDGADEIAPGLDLIKGGGGALLREKMVAQASRRVVIIADESKLVRRLGEVSALPVEVVPWGWEWHARFLRGWGAEVSVRAGPGGELLRTDNGQLLLDCRFPGGIAEPLRLERALADRAGVVESGLFLGLADEAYVASRAGVERLARA